MEAEDYVMPTEKHEDRPGYPFASKRRPTDLSDEAQLGHATVDATTIVQRLRSMQDPLAHEAATHIEQLRASLKLRNQLIASAAKLLSTSLQQEL